MGLQATEKLRANKLLAPIAPRAQCLHAKACTKERLETNSKKLEEGKSKGCAHKTSATPITQLEENQPQCKDAGGKDRKRTNTMEGPSRKVSMKTLTVSHSV